MLNYNKTIIPNQINLLTTRKNITMLLETLFSILSTCTSTCIQNDYHFLCPIYTYEGYMYYGGISGFMNT